MRQMRSRLSWFFPFVLAILFTLFVNACASEQNRELKTLKIGITTWPGFDIVLYAKEASLFKKRGIDVQLIRFDNQQDSTRAVLRGSLDAAFVSLWDVMQADPENDNPVFIMVSNISAGADGIVTQSKIKSVAELRGKQIGAKLGTVNHLILLEALQLHRIKPERVQIEDVSNETAAQLMSQNRLDAAVVWEPLLSSIAKKIKGNIVFTTKEIDSLVIDGLFSRSQVVAAKKVELTQFILAWFDIMQAVDTNPEEVFALVGQQLGQSSQSFASDYAGLKKGDIAMNQRMFQPQGRLQQAAVILNQLLREDSRHGRLIRTDLEINAAPVTTAIKAWKP